MDELIDGLKKRDESALREVMTMYKTKIYNYLRVLVGNSELAEELTQDTFVKVYFKAHTLRTDNLNSWIYTIATNLARSEFRKNKIKYMFSLADVKEGNFSVKPTLENEIIVQQLIAQLPEKYRIPVVMKEIQNFSFDEIATILGKPVGTIKTLVFRGKKQLRGFLESPDDDRPLKKKNKEGVEENAGSRPFAEASINK